MASLVRTILGQMRIRFSSTLSSNHGNIKVREINADSFDDHLGRPLVDPVASAFFSPTVQSSLHRLTGMNYDKVFRIRRRGQKIAPPKYVFMTEEQLQKARQAADRRAKSKWLQMPPVMSARRDEKVILDVDPAIQGYDAAKYVFTDITYGVNDRARLIVVRDPDGTLREAYGEERDRLNQIYFPITGRKVLIPPLFADAEVLANALVLGKDRYEYVLDRNCVQFEPDNPLYIKTAETVYKTIDEKRDYDVLKSTRHFGPMMFWLAWNKLCDNYIMHQLDHDNLSNASETVLLYSLLHSDSKVASALPNQDFSSSDSSASDSDSDDSEDKFSNHVGALRLYIKHDAVQGSKLLLTLESFLERREECEKSLDGIHRAHGAAESINSEKPSSHNKVKDN